MTDLKLLTFRGDFRSFKALIAAQYNNVTVELPAFDQAQAQSQAFLAKSPAGKVPVLETSEGPIFESNAIARYVARLRRDTGLLGGSFYESALVDAWVDWTSHELELPATLWVYPILGYMENVESVTARAKTDLLNALNVLEKHLLLRTFLVGEHVTLADIVVASALFYPMKLVLDAKTRRKYPSVERWFLTCVGQTQFAAVVGAEVPLCDKPLTAAGAAAPAAGKAAGAEEAKTEGKKAGKKGGEAKPKAEQKPKAEAKKEAPKPKPAEEEDDGLDEAEIAAKAPAQDTLVTALGKLPRSTMAIDTWKRTYANSRSEGFYPAMPKFWEMLDREGYSVWRCDYNYNEENKVDFMVSNLVSGFVQRSEDMRKYAFGAMQILGAAAPYEVTGMWLFRGQSNAPLLEANPDAEYYTWTKEDPEDPAARERVGHYWCAAETLNGKPIFDCKMFY